MSRAEYVFDFFVITFLHHSVGDRICFLGDSCTKRAHQEQSVVDDMPPPLSQPANVLGTCFETVDKVSWVSGNMTLGKHERCGEWQVAARFLGSHDGVSLWRWPWWLFSLRCPSEDKGAQKFFYSELFPSNHFSKTLSS